MGSIWDPWCYFSSSALEFQYLIPVGGGWGADILSMHVGFLFLKGIEISHPDPILISKNKLDS